jgi:hypothetical protein
MCNFILPGKEELPGDQCVNRIQFTTGKKLYPEWQTKSPHPDRKKIGKEIMPGNLKDILSSLSTDVDQETLLLYLQGKLSEDKKHEVEKKLMESEFTDDAMEGLQEIRDKEQIPYIVEMLNRELKKKTEKKKKQREKMRIKDQPWLYISILILIILLVMVYVVIYRMNRL